MVDQATKIRDEIVSGGSDLAHTVQAIVDNADVRSRVRDLTGNAEQIQKKASETASRTAGQLTSRARDVSRTARKSRRGSLGRLPAPYMVGGIAALLVVVFFLRRRRDRD